MLRMALLALVPAMAAATTGIAHAQTVSDSAAIRAAAFDYIEGWYTADADRMSRALHPELVKRWVPAAGGRRPIVTMGASQLVAATYRGGGSELPRDERHNEV